MRPDLNYHFDELTPIRDMCLLLAVLILRPSIHEHDTLKHIHRAARA